jgi:hypothetical protein
MIDLDRPRIASVVKGDGEEIAMDRPSGNRLEADKACGAGVANALGVPITEAA